MKCVRTHRLGGLELKIEAAGGERTWVRALLSLLYREGEFEEKAWEAVASAKSTNHKLTVGEETEG